MVFSSLIFLFIYLPVVLAVYYIVPVKWRNPWLFVVNFIFYGWGEPVYLFLMIFSITVNYIHGYFIHKYRENDALAKRFVLSNTIINLALLVFFKYFDLIAVTLSAIPGLHFITPLGITLPIGISFYTFQTMSYPIDVYREDADVQKNYISFGTFVALFPQLIAGPIVRYKDVSEQLDFRAGSLDQFASGIRRFIVGLGKKVLIANTVSLLWNIYKAMPLSELTVLGSWLGIIAFSFQIYFDFSGYSDMAIGLGRMLGFEFLENFDYPYIAKSITEFWRRWHMSLGTWFRDYVYIPLGGNRRGYGRQFLNIIIVWALTGIWHGANWTFLVWGIYYAFFLILEKSFLLRVFEKTPPWIQHLYTLLIVVCGWVFFDLDSFSRAGHYFSAMFGASGTGLFSPADLYYLSNFAIMLIVSALASTKMWKNLYDKINPRVQSVITPLLIIIVLALSTAYLVDNSYNPFIYFRF